MAMRRPRIKPVANILSNSKRKTKSINEEKTSKVDEINANGVHEVVKVNNVPTTQKENYDDSVFNPLEVIPESSVDTKAKKNTVETENNNVGVDIQEFENNAKSNIIKNKNVIVQKDLSNTREQRLNNTQEVLIDTLNESDAFKCPKVGFQRTISHTSNSGIDDVFYADIEENALQMDLEKPQSNSCPISPSKNSARQRIRPTPHFGQRRNSFIGTSPSPHTYGNEDNHAANNNVNSDMVETITHTIRERHHSSSFSGNSHSSSGSPNSHHHTMHKYLPTGITNSCTGRIRTESCCSVLSDTNTSTHKLRKSEDHKQNYRKEFEARFHNGVPAKNVLKMSDLIYYNPVTNPMEQKPNPKLEPPETPKEDNSYTEISEKKDASADSEAVPVPQLKLNAKGELILDDSSLVIETTAEQEARKVLANSSLIYLDEYTGMNGFYSRQKRTRKWPASETVKFYRCLQNVGTDFSLMVPLFPNRTRRDLKLKFKKEERKNFHLISKALVHPKEFDIESLKQQLDDEEKLVDKSCKPNKKKTCKLEKKKKINAPSSASRVLSKGSIYQNEIAPKPKHNQETNISSDKSKDVGQKEKKTIEKTRKDSIHTDGSKDVTHSESGHEPNQAKNNACEKSCQEQVSSNDTIASENSNLDGIASNKMSKQQRVRTYKKMQKKENIKEEIIKIESSSELKEISASIEYRDTKELQTEIDELLDSDAIDIQYGITSYEATNIHVPAETSEVGQLNEQMNNAPSSHIEEQGEDVIDVDTDIDKYEHRSFVNFDDGSVEVYSNVKDDVVFVTTHQSSSPFPAPSDRSPSPQLTPEPLMSLIQNENNSKIDVNNDIHSSAVSGHELSEADIQSILTDLAEGSLVLVSTLDPEDPDKVLNEIYMVDKNTGELCDEPLSIPDNIVQCILAVVS